jgi:hypothetical protein
MKRFFPYLCMIIFVACSSPDETPPGIISAEEMKPLIWDVMKAQNLAQQMAKKDSTLNDSIETVRLTEKVFNIYKINKEEFKKSYDWYIKHPTVLKEIFDSLYFQKQRNTSEFQRPAIPKEATNKKFLRFEKNRFKLLHSDTLY